MTSGIRLAIAGAAISGVTAYMGYLGAATSWKYYLTVDECLTAGSSLEGARLRVSGTVASGSLAIGPHDAQVSFALVGSTVNLPVSLSGRPPDNLAEQREVVVEGQMTGAAHLRADRVFTRCASKYTTSASALGASRLTDGVLAHRGT